MAATVQLFALVLALTGASANDQGEGEASDCLLVRNISGYAVIDDHHLLLHGGESRHYLITTNHRCAGLREGVEVGLSFSNSGRVCQPDREFIIPEDGWRCAISTIEAVESEAAARALIEERNAQAEN